MDVGTAKVDRETRARIRHHGLDLVDPDQPFSVADFQREANAALEGMAARGGVAVLVGGTGFYLRAVARGMDLSTAGSDSALRADLEERLTQRRLPALAAELSRLAPTLAAVTDLANPRRVVRALERAHLHGDVLPPVPLGYPAPVLWLGVRLDRTVHRERVAQRAAEQFATGLLDEARELGRRFPPDLPAFSAFGYWEAFALLRGEIDLDEAIRRDVDRTWGYARRQRTWFRSEPDIQWLEGGREALGAARRRVERFLAGQPRPR